MAQRVKMLRHPLGVDENRTHVCANALLEGGCTWEPGPEHPCVPVGQHGGCGENMCLGLGPGEGYFVHGSQQGGSSGLCTHLAAQVRSMVQVGVYG